MQDMSLLSKSSMTALAELQEPSPADHDLSYLKAAKGIDGVLSAASGLYMNRCSIWSGLVAINGDRSGVARQQQSIGVCRPHRDAVLQNPDE